MRVTIETSALYVKEKLIRKSPQHLFLALSKGVHNDLLLLQLLLSIEFVA